MSENEPSPLEFPLSDGISLKISDEPFPRNLEISELQKGLILAINGINVIEEGAGFGSPVIKYRDKTYFSQTAKVEVQDKSKNKHKVTKKYLMDTISLKEFRDKGWINDGIYHPIHRVFSICYLKMKPLRSLFDSMISARKKLGIETRYVKTAPRGVVEVTYRIQKDTIKITIDISGLIKENLEEVVILNEQGADQFPYYSDSDGLNLSKEEIGAWDLVKAGTATLTSLDGVSYSQDNIQAASLIRGWEKIEARHSWSGLNYIIKPDKDRFTYNIVFSRTKRT